MSGLEMKWPDEGAERVRAAQGRLVHAGRELRRRSFDERLASVTRILEDWAAPDSPWRRELATSLAATTPFELGTITEGLDSAMRAWDPEQFARCARAELILLGRTLAPFESTTVIAGGAIPMPTILSGLIPLVAGSPVLLRETSKDSVSAGLLARSIAARDEGLARCFEPIAFPSTDGPALAQALSAPCVVATGADETLRRISAALRPTQRFVAYGHRFSIGIVGPQIVNNPEGLQRVAHGFAIDVARWDQSGCLSPVVLYLVDVPSGAARTLATSISDALERLAQDMPRGALDSQVRASLATERAEARMRCASGGSMLLEGSDHTIVLEEGAQPRPAPLHRFLRLMPVDSLEALDRALTPFEGHLSHVALCGFSSTGWGDRHDSHDANLLLRLSALGVSRITIPGALQTPPVDWPHDGMPLFTPIARFARLDRPSE